MSDKIEYVYYKGQPVANGWRFSVERGFEFLNENSTWVMDHWWREVLWAGKRIKDESTENQVWTDWADGLAERFKDELMSCRMCGRKVLSCQIVSKICDECYSVMSNVARDPELARKTLKALDDGKDISDL